MSHLVCYTRRTKDKENEMKRLIMKLLGAKFMLNGHYYWSLGTAMDEAKKSGLRETVWIIGWRSSYYAKAYVAESRWTHTHPDAANFNPFQ